MEPLLISRYTATTCLGHGLAPLREALVAGRSGLKPCAFETVELDTWVGEVEGTDEEKLAARLRDFDCRNNRLAQIGLAQDGFADAVHAAISRYGAGRIGVLVGTSTAGILETELAYRRRDADTGALPPDFRYAGSHNPYSIAAFVRAYFELSGPAVAVSSACSSSAKVFASASRMIAAGLIDAAVAGGVDSLCLTTLYGFNSLELTSTRACRPFDRARDGISIGEAAAFALLERAPVVGCGADTPDGAVLLLGVGESSDAYHMSSPHPEGRGAREAMEGAVAAAGLDAADIGYINLHGTATPSNDAAEGHAVRALFADGTPCSSTKGATGHTLGAAGAVEAVVAALALCDGFMPAGVNTTEPEPGLDYLVATRHERARYVLSNSFGFGGTNCSLVLGGAR